MAVLAGSLVQALVLWILAGFLVREGRTRFDRELLAALDDAGALARCDVDPGATGFIGSEVVRWLQEAGHGVLGLARSESSARALETKEVEVQRGDPRDLESLRAGAEASATTAARDGCSDLPSRGLVQGFWSKPGVTSGFRGCDGNSSCRRQSLDSCV